MKQRQKEREKENILKWVNDSVWASFLRCHVLSVHKTFSMGQFPNFDAAQALEGNLASHILFVFH